MSSVTTTVTNVDVEAFPAGFGHHPYFVRSLTPDCGEPQLEIPVTAGYALESAMAVGEAGPVPARADYSTLRPLGGRFVDDCLTGRMPGPVRIVYPGARVDGSDVEVRITADDVYSHWVVYVPVQRAYFAVEPVTNANGGFALAEQGVPGTGVFVHDRDVHRQPVSVSHRQWLARAGGCVPATRNPQTALGGCDGAIASA